LRARVMLADRTRPREERAKRGLEISEDLMKEGAPWAVALGLLVRASALALEDLSDQSLGQSLAMLHAAEEQLVATQMVGWLHIAKVRRGVLEGSQGSHARAAAARDALRDVGVVDPERLVAVLLPWES
jgi:hypothetical protein